VSVGVCVGLLTMWRTAARLVGYEQAQAEARGAHEGPVWSLAFHPVGHILCSGSNDCSAKFWCRNRPGEIPRDGGARGHGCVHSLASPQRPLRSFPHPREHTHTPDVCPSSDSLKPLGKTWGDQKPLVWEHRLEFLKLNNLKHVQIELASHLSPIQAAHNHSAL